jgi:YYY domain-containing protein
MMSDFFYALRWWAVLLLIGTTAVPLAYTFFQQLPDRGYAFVKMLGLLIVGYLFWLLASLGVVANGLGGILLALLGLAGLSAAAYWRRADIWGVDGDVVVERPSLPDWLRQNWRYILLTELLFLLIFGLWVWVRAQHPAIEATEKPMEFAFLNAASFSPHYPPLDPWLSGFAISYYYFGYVMTSVVARLAAVPEFVAFNLGVAWLIAGTAVGSFGLVYNLILVKDFTAKACPEQCRRAQRTLRRKAVLFGLLAALAIPLAGNLQVGLELIYLRGLGSNDFWTWLDVQDLNAIDAPVEADSFRYMWWWRTSRVVNEYHLSGQQAGLQPIAEIPAFSFILGDLHPHVLALPFALLALALALNWYLATGTWHFNWNRLRNGRFPIVNGQSSMVNGQRTPDPPNSQFTIHNSQFTIPYTPPILILFTAVVLGGIAFLNTWDILAYLFILTGAFILARWRQAGWQTAYLTDGILLAGLLFLLATLLYIPFYIGFSSQAGAPYILPMLMRPTRLSHFLIIFGMPLLPVIGLLLFLLWRHRRHWLEGVITAVSLPLVLFLIMLFFSWIVASSPEGAGRVVGLANELGLTLPPRPEGTVALGWGAQTVATILPTVLSVRLTYSAVSLLLTIMAGLVVMGWLGENNGYPPQRTQSAQNNMMENSASSAPSAVKSPSSTLPFVLLLIGTGALLTIGPEYLYLRDNFGVRMNTIFKFYYQAWLLFGVAAPVALHYLWQNGLPQRHVTSTSSAQALSNAEGRKERENNASSLGVLSAFAVKFLPSLLTTGYIVALAIGLLYPYYAVQTRSEEFRGPLTAETRQPATLNGLARVERNNPGEYAAVLWLRENTAGDAVIVEAVGGAYSEYGRMSANSGRPTLLGWANHQYQWRGSDTPEPPIRERAVEQIYTLPAQNLAETADLLNRYNVRYIIVGQLERRTYPNLQEEKFRVRLPIVFENESITIYGWQPE